MPPRVARWCLLSVLLGVVSCTSSPESLAARCEGGGSACAKAKEKLQRQCELGHADACHALAVVYANGRGGPKEPAKAREFYDAACERGRAESCRAAKGLPGAAARAVQKVAAGAAPAPEPAAPEPAASPPEPAAPPAAAPDAAAAAAPAPKPVKRAPSGPSRETLQRRCEANDEAACMALGKEMIKAEARKNPAAARALLEQMKQACSDGDADACELIKRGLRGR